MNETISAAGEAGRTGESPAKPWRRRAAPVRNGAFLSLLHARGLTVADLAGLIGSERSHVSRVLNGYPNRGGRTRRRLARHLTAEELRALGWDAEGKWMGQSGVQGPKSGVQGPKVAAGGGRSEFLAQRISINEQLRNVLRGTTCHVEQAAGGVAWEGENIEQGTANSEQRRGGGDE